ncbi:MAG TPA: hypothetical protein VLG69_00110 [Candidatus Andersenbacteria bacterium]|nr:hypothetical protein [Candidatus Andersenbacteria bacterium]
MRISSKLPVTIFLLCMFIYGFYIQNHSRTSSLSTVSDTVQNILVHANTSLIIASPVPKQHCVLNGPLPDHECTPGAIFPDANKDVICVQGYTKKVRSVSASTKKSIYIAYGIVYPQPTGSYEADHLIPLELGGSNEVANLFPEAGSPTPGFHEKDLVENYLHQEVCAGRIDVSAAQKQIANDWLAVYNQLTPEQIKELRSQYASWTDKN